MPVPHLCCYLVLPDKLGQPWQNSGVPFTFLFRCWKFVVYIRVEADLTLQVRLTLRTEISFNFFFIGFFCTHFCDPRSIRLNILQRRRTCTVSTTWWARIAVTGSNFKCQGEIRWADSWAAASKSVTQWGCYTIKTFRGSDKVQERYVVFTLHSATKSFVLALLRALTPVPSEEPRPTLKNFRNHGLEF